MAAYVREIQPQVALGRTYKDLHRWATRLELEARLAPDAVLRREATEKALKVRAAWDQLMADYERIGIEGSRVVDEMIRKQIDATHSGRPDRPGPRRLRNAVHSRALPSTLPSGAVGIGDIELLNRGTAAGRGRSFWRAQNYGLPAVPEAERKAVPGYFMEPGQAPPDAGQFRGHAYFQQMSYARGMPALLRRNPVPARHFMELGTKEFLGWWRREAKQAQDRAFVVLAKL